MRRVLQEVQTHRRLEGTRRGEEMSQNVEGDLRSEEEASETSMILEQTGQIGHAGRKGGQSSSPLSTHRRKRRREERSEE